MRRSAHAGRLFSILPAGPKGAVPRYMRMPSSVIRSYHYHADRRALEIEFTTGRRYLYFEVPPDEVEALGAAFSKGRYFNAHIRDNHDYAELVGADD